ncbi:uncharacterized protein LOC113272784 [Papaver somniferum]|uniref:uncharacterized protein LOC113272784 n=1 Tax=Papaver somniferum TaxID=3469 RepID=UPI000E6FCE94|nr:uncharacterized protein LOC113272784 [Papaver somniferum]
MYPSWAYKVGARWVSDHSTLFGGNNSIPKPTNVPFRAVKVWKNHYGFLPLIKDSWSKAVKDQEPENTILLNKLVTARGKLEVLSQQQKDIIQQKSRVMWLKDGASNTKFFHVNMKVRQAQNMIIELEDDDGNIITSQRDISSNLVAHFEEKFKFQEVEINHQFLDVIPKVINTEDNKMLESTPSKEEIKTTIFVLNPESAPEPDGFAGRIYRYAWEIIGKVLTDADQYCWRRSFIPEGLNANFLKLIPKTNNAKKAKKYRPIGLINFSFKIFTKIWATRLGSIIHKMVSPQQGAFIKGRTIQEQIALAYEMVNELDIKRRGGNFGLKIDITQAYDSLSWNFLFQVMSKFGVSDTTIYWLQELLNSARISILVNGGPEGYFKVGRGLRQGNSMSPLLFVIAEDALSRKITSEIQKYSLKEMMMFFCFVMGKEEMLKKLMELLKIYHDSSGQRISMEKSRCFIGGTSDRRKLQILEECGIPLSEFPDKYLGVQLFSGGVKSYHVWNGVEMMKDRLAGWKVYRWPKRVIKECERIIRNFLWTGDPSQRKQVTLKWNKVCSPLSEGGLGIIRLEVVNKALIMKLFWKIQHGTEEMSKFFQAKFQNKKGERISYYNKSSICQGIKWVMEDVQEGTRWLVGNGENISVWKDKWIQDRALEDNFHNHSYVQQFPNMKVADLILEREWVIPGEMMKIIEINELPVLGGGEDRRIWTHTISGEFNVASVVEAIREKFPKMQWKTQVWHPSIHPNISSNIWKLVSGICATYENLKKRKVQLASRCCFCKKKEENKEHLLWFCYLSEIIWKWLGNMFNFINPKSFEESLKITKNKSPAIKEVWRAASFITMRELLFTRNKLLYE